MDKKKILIYSISSAIILIGGFLLLDNFFFHLIFKAKPGSCLILEEKYCQTGELKYKDDLPIGIIYKVPKNAKIFSPITSTYSSNEVKTTENFTRKLFIVGNQKLDESQSSATWYQIFFRGNISTDFNNNIIGKIISKGDVLGITSGDSTIDVILIPKTVSLNSSNTIDIVENQEEMIRIFNNSKK